MPLVATRGAASSQGFGEFARTGPPPVYIEDVFSTYIYAGNSSTQTITNGIDLSTKGGLVWSKCRSQAATHILQDSARGVIYSLSSENANVQTTANSDAVTGFTTTGYTLGGNNAVNQSGQNNVSWTFRKQPKFFDIQIISGNGSTQVIPHNLGSTPGCIMIKRLENASSDWIVYHRSLTNGVNGSLILNNTVAEQTSPIYFSSVTSTSFTVEPRTEVNANFNTYVAYLFAHNAGGFGTSGSDNVISCGSYVGNNGTNPVNLGYEAQFVLIKNITNTTGSSNWVMYDSMRGLSMTSASVLRPNLAIAETTDTTIIPSSTGFTITGGGGSTNFTGDTYIYIAIRRGPMKTPTTGTSVFSPLLTTNSTGATNTTGFPVDLQLWTLTGGYQTTAQDRLRGVSTTSTQTSCPELLVPYTNAESSNAFQVRNWNNTGFETPSAVSGSSTIWWNFRRAPGFFDVVCYTGDAAATNNQNHNLGVTPEMLIFKSRNNADNWAVFFPVQDTFTRLNSTSGKLNGSSLPSAVTSTTFNVGNTTGYSSVASVNISGYTYVTYLFASVAGVSKVGSYTGTGALQTVNCGFTTGARFILIKRTDSTGDWWVYDSARGISSGNDPYILINVPGVAQVTGTNYVDTTSVGFQVTAAAPAGLNANGGTYIFLAIA